MELGQDFVDNLKQAEEWVRRLRKWAERVDSHPTLLGIISLLKYIPSNGAQSARNKLEDVLEEQSGDTVEIQMEGESEDNYETYEIDLEESEGEINLVTKSDHRVTIEADEESIVITHGDDPSNIFYPRMKERLAKSLEKEWNERQMKIITEQAIHQLFKSELERARSTLRWAIQEHQEKDY